MLAGQALCELTPQPKTFPLSTTVLAPRLKRVSREGSHTFKGYTHEHPEFSPLFSIYGSNFQLSFQVTSGLAYGLSSLSSWPRSILKPEFAQASWSEI